MKKDPCTKTQQYYKKGDLETAYSYATRCIKFITKSLKKASSKERDEIRTRLVMSYQFHSILAFQLKLYSVAKESIKHSIDILTKLTESDRVTQLFGESYYTFGLILVMQKQSPVEEWRRSIEYHIKANNYRIAISIILEIVKHLDGDQKQELDRALKLSKKLRKKERDIAQGNIYVELSRFDSANSSMYLKKSRKLFDKRSHIDGKIKVLITLASLDESSIEKSKEYLIEALDLANIHQSPEMLGIVYTQLGIISLKLGEFEKGKKHLLSGLKFRTETGDKEGTAQTLVELARLSLITARNTDDLFQSSKLIDQAIELYGTNSNEYGLLVSHELASSIHTKSGKYELAVNHAKQARRLARKIDNKELEARILVQLAVALDGVGKSDEVIPILEKSVKLYNQTGLQLGIAEVKYLMGLHYERSNQEMAREKYIESKSIYEEEENPSNEIKMMIKLIENKLEAINS